METEGWMWPEGIGQRLKILSRALVWKNRLLLLLPPLPLPQRSSSTGPAQFYRCTSPLSVTALTLSVRAPRPGCLVLLSSTVHALAVPSARGLILLL